MGGNGKLSIILIAFFAIFVSISSAYHYETKEIEVPLDHFSYANNATFKLRYLYNATFAKNHLSPILFYTGNEGDIELFAANTGFQWELASSLQAVVVFAEHRYYGKSLPFGNDSFKSATQFGYLTAEQALADFAFLIDELTDGENNRPVIALGGSYGGMLAAWIRMKYPHKVAGALAASAPIWQFTNLTKCNIFSKILTSVYATGINNDQSNRNCSINIKKSWEVFESYSKTDKGKATLNNAFHFCKGMEITKPEDLQKFFEYLEDVYGNLAMANYPYDNTFLSPLPAYPVAQFCMYLKTAVDNDDLVKSMQQALNVYYNFTGKTKCLDYKSAYEPSMGDAGWDIQTCNEMVMPMCSSGGDDDMFRKKDWSFKEYSDKCFAKYQVRPREREMLIRYGGFNIETASNIIFSNGLLDPWSGGGVMRTSNKKVYIIIIPEGAHHIDLRASNPKDPRSVSEARTIEENIIKSWIQNFYQRTVY